MAQDSQMWLILQAAQSIIQAIGLIDWNGRPVPVTATKMPKNQDNIDSPPAIFVCPDRRPEAIHQLSFESVSVTYRIEVAVIAAGDRNFTAHIADYTSWREQIRQRFQSPAALQAVIPTAFQVQVEPDAILDRQAIKDSYDNGSLTVIVTNAETRGT